jgi:protoporphyrin/coproporphyrin ferrochelatase
MDCVNDHPEFCRMVADWAEEHIEALLSQEALSVNSSVTISHIPSGQHHHHHHDHHHHH